MRELGAGPTPPPTITAAPDLDAASAAEEDLELDGEFSEEVSRLNVEDPVLARREMRNIEEEVEQVRAALLTAHGNPGSPDAGA